MGQSAGTSEHFVEKNRFVLIHLFFFMEMRRMIEIYGACLARVIIL